LYGSVGAGGNFTSTGGTGVFANGGAGIGVYAYGDQIGVDAESSTNGIGVYAVGGTGLAASGIHGAAIYGSIDNTAANVYTIRADLATSTPGAGSAAVYGQNAGTTGNGYGIYGTHIGTGWGGYFTSNGGIGVYGSGGSGTGVVGSGTATGVKGSSTSGYGGQFTSSTNYGVRGSSIKSIGIRASGGTDGIYATGTNGRGAQLGGGAAQLKLRPSSAATHPASGQAGDFFVDSSKRLWFCKGGSTWRQVA
jgi:hypothetical protein